MRLPLRLRSTLRLWCFLWLRRKNRFGNANGLRRRQMRMHCGRYRFHRSGRYRVSRSRLGGTGNILCLALVAFCRCK